MADSQILIKTYQDGVLKLTLNRQPVNALNAALIAGLQSAFTEAAGDDQVRCVLLTGAGRVFSAGQDLTDFDPTPSTPYRRHLLRTYNPLILQIRRLPKPVLAAVNGPVSGAALGIALACDLRIAADSASFMVGFGAIGLAPDSAVSILLPALIGLGRASELAFGASDAGSAKIDASRALEWGLINRIALANQLGQQAAEWAAQLARGPVQTIGLTKRALNKAVLDDLEAILDYEAHLQEIAGQGAEHHEGIRAFIEKRPPNFS